MEATQEIIPMIKPDIEALNNLLNDYHEGIESIDTYKEKRQAILDGGTRAELSVKEYNDIISKLMDMLADDFTEGIFDTDEYKDELEVLEAQFFTVEKKTLEVAIAKDGFIDGDIRYDEETISNKILFTNPEKRINYYTQKGRNFLMKRTSESTTIIYDNRRFIYSHSNAFPNSKLFLFRNVKKDVEKWLANRKFIQLPPKHEASVYNYDYDDSFGKVCGTDLNHAYWRIAFLKGIISESTYNYGLDESCKALRLATISVLGREKSYYKYINGKIDHKVLIKPADEKLQSIFKYIRYYCYQMMFDLSKMLGDDFDCWQTDCIYYRDTEENVKKVHKFLNKRGLTFKQLEE